MRRLQILNKVLLMMQLVFLCMTANGQYIFIPDSNFRHALINRGFASCFDVSLTMLDTTCGLVNGTASLDLTASQISDLEGLKYFKNLDTLICAVNRLSALPSLPQSMHMLNCSGNLLTKIASLPDSLYSLFCMQNQIDSLPTLSIYLTNLNCFNNRLTCLPDLPNTLVSLSCGDNFIVTLPALPPYLKVFDCADNLLKFLPKLPDSLCLLYCPNNQLTELPSLPKSLTRLECFDNDLATLPEMPDSLNWFNCINNLHLHCLPHLNKVVEILFFNTDISCLPNYPDKNKSSVPALSGMPLCELSNTTECNFYPYSLLSVYPIPTYSLITFSIVDHTINMADISIFDVVGRVVTETEAINSNKFIFDMSRYATGTYYYTVTDANDIKYHGKFEYVH